jgi:integration host factor subunit alpha
MANHTVTRTNLLEAIQKEVGLPRSECADRMEDVLKIIADCLVEGGSANVPNFGSFSVRSEPERVGRNPKNEEEFPILSRRVVKFTASQGLKNRISQQAG